MALLTSVARYSSQVGSGERSGVALLGNFELGQPDSEPVTFVGCLEYPCVSDLVVVVVATVDQKYRVLPEFIGLPLSVLVYAAIFGLPVRHSWPSFRLGPCVRTPRAPSRSGHPQPNQLSIISGSGASVAVRGLFVGDANHYHPGYKFPA